MYEFFEHTADLGLRIRAADLNTLKGKKLTGDLIAINDQAIVLKTSAGEVATPLPDAMQLQLTPTPDVKFPDKYIDVEGYASGTECTDPYTGNNFIVP